MLTKANSGLKVFTELKIQFLEAKFDQLTMKIQEQGLDFPSACPKWDSFRD